MKNYYLILQVDPDATPDEIRAAYRRLAKELHPDYYKAGSQPFLALQEAYAVLSDPDRRRAYDQSLQEAQKKPRRPAPPRPSTVRPEPLIPDPEPFPAMDPLRSYSPSLDEVFDQLWQNFGPVHPKTGAVKSLNVEVTITPRQAWRGGRIQLAIPARLVCPTCRGYGGVGFFDCLRCGGTGVIQADYPVMVTFPPGTPDGYTVELSLDRLGIHNGYLTVIFRVK